MRSTVDPLLRKANVRLAGILGLISIGFFVLFLLVGIA